MTTGPADQILDAIDNALAGMTPQDREHALRQYVDDMRANLEHLQALPPDQRDTAIREITAEMRRFNTDITAAGPGALHQFALQAAHTLRLRGANGPVLDQQEAARVTEALERGQHRHKAFRACRHILAGGPVIARGGAHLCITHPEHGARCQDCHELHVTTTHDPIEERTCDHCRTVLDEIYPCAAIGPAAFRAATPNRRTRYVPALLAVVGIGYCETCRDQRGTSHPATPNPTPETPDRPIGTPISDIISAGIITRDQAVDQLAAHLTDRDAYVMMVNPAHLAALTERLHRIPEWTAYIDTGTDDIIRTDEAAVLLVADVVMPNAAVLTIPKTVPASIIGDAIDEPVPDDGSRDILMLGFIPDGPMVWSLLFLDALEHVDPAMVATIRAAKIPDTQ